MKKAWQRPQLIVLVRSESQEAILQICKGYLVGTESMDQYPGCAYGIMGLCVGCDVFSAS